MSLGPAPRPLGPGTHRCTSCGRYVDGDGVKHTGTEVVTGFCTWCRGTRRVYCEH